MFVQAAKFIEAHGGNTKAVNVYGQESEPATYRLAKMNLAIRGISYHLGDRAVSTFSDDQHKELKFDYIMANPPFNLKKYAEYGGFETDSRWQGYGVPPTSNANYAWILHILNKLNVSRGIAGFLLANGALDDSDTLEIRKLLIESDKVEAIIVLPRNMFYSTDISVTLWILNNNKKGGPWHGRQLRNRTGEILFIDLRTWNSNIYEKKYVRLTEADIDRVRQIYFNWQTENFVEYAEPELYYAAHRDEIQGKGYSLVPSRYIEFIDRDTEIDYQSALSEMSDKFNALKKRWDANETELVNAFKILGYGKNKLQHHNITTDTLFDDIRNIIEQGRRQAYAAANQITVLTYWHIGRRIVEEEQHGEARAQYGTRLIKTLAEQLMPKYGNTFSKRNLDYFRQFYLCFNDLEIVNTRVHNLTWSHFRSIIQVADPKAREWYVKEASEQMWSVRTLNRNIGTQYYGRRMACVREGLALPSPDIEANDPLEYIKSPVVAEFLGFRKDSKYDESQLEQALIDHLQQFIMELGRGFAFVDRQKHISTDTGDFYIDLVFYNIKLKRYVLFELKTHPLTHADVGQLDMYVRMYDDLVKDENDNPTIGILLCTETDKVMAKYSVLNGSEQLFAAKYMAYMPTEEELSREIEQQKRFFLEQHGKEE